MTYHLGVPITNIVTHGKNGSLVIVGELNVYIPEQYNPEVGMLLDIYTSGEYYHPAQTGELLTARRVGFGHSIAEWVGVPHQEQSEQQFLPPSEPPAIFELSPQAEVYDRMSNQLVMIVRYPVDRPIWVAEVAANGIRLIQGAKPINWDTGRLQRDIGRVAEMFPARSSIQVVGYEELDGTNYFIEILVAGRPVNGAVIGTLWTEHNLPFNVVGYAVKLSTQDLEVGDYVKIMYEDRENSRRLAFRAEAQNDEPDANS